MTFFEPTAAPLAALGSEGLIAALFAMLAVFTYMVRTAIKRMDRMHLDRLEDRRENRESHRETNRKIERLHAKIDENQKANHATTEGLHAKIDKNQKAIHAKIDENQKAIHAKIDANQKTARAGMDENRRWHEARSQELSASLQHLDGKVEAMMELLRFVITARTPLDSGAKKPKAGAAA